MALTEQTRVVLAAARDGDQKAMEQLLLLCQPDIRRYAQRHCVISDVDDAVQEVLIILIRKLESLRILSAFSSWLFRTVQRECRRLGRKTFGFDPYDEEILENWLANHSTDELRLELARAIESLPPHYRDVILMSDFDEMTTKEIAAHLNLSPAAVKSQLRRARLATRDLLLGS